MLVTLIKIFPFNMNEYSAEGICFNKSRDLTSKLVMGRTTQVIGPFGCSSTFFKVKDVLDFILLFPYYFFIILTMDLWSAGCTLIGITFKTISW